MKRIICLLLICLHVFFIACRSKKNSQSPVPAPSNVTSATATPTVSSAAYTPAFSATGIYLPGERELAAIRLKQNDATMEQLNTGYYIYTVGACIGCHPAQSIYPYSETQWKSIMDDMAGKAKLTAAEKQSVYLYVLAIKAAR